MMIAQVDHHKVIDHAIPPDTEAASRLLFSVSAKTKSTDPQDEGQYRPISGSMDSCVGFCSPLGEVRQRMAGGSVKEPGSRSHMGNPGEVLYRQVWGIGTLRHIFARRFTTTPWYRSWAQHMAEAAAAERAEQ